MMCDQDMLVSAHRELREATAALDNELYRMMGEQLAQPSAAYLAAAERFREAERVYRSLRRQIWGI
jgi:hypothetical protein